MSKKFSLIRRRAGFTLMEILMVVVIALSVAAFAVPAYKKMKTRNDFTAAQGFFLEVYSALNMCIADQLADKSTTGFSKCYSDNTIHYDFLTHPDDGVPPYLQPYDNTVLHNYTITANTVDANNLKLTLSPAYVGISKYQAVIDNGELSITVGS